MPNLSKGQPDYKTLRCQKCGNTTRFREIALTETSQPFTVNGDEVDFGLSSILDAPNFPQEIRCAECDEVVWAAE